MIRGKPAVEKVDLYEPIVKEMLTGPPFNQRKSAVEMLICMESVIEMGADETSFD